jgi:DNA-binding beta-propeller fold protein YncE
MQAKEKLKKNQRGNSMKKVFSFLASILLTALLAFCSKDPTPTDSNQDIDYSTITDIGYTEHVQVILNEYKDILTAANIYPEGLLMDSWENLIKGWKRGEVIIPFDVANSLLIELTTKLDYQNKLRADKLDLLQRWIDQGAKNDNGEIPYANSQKRLYVCSQAEAIINIIDVDALVVIRNVHLTDFGLPQSAKPHHIAFSSDGNYFFVSCIDNQVNKILKFDMANNEMVGEATTSIPALLDHHPTENLLYVSRFMDPQNPLTSIFLLNTETMQPAQTGFNGEIPLPPTLTIPHAMKMDLTGNYAYSASLSEDWFLVVNHTTKEFEDAIFLGNNKDRTPMQLAVSPDNNKVYISCIGSGEIVAINVSDPANRFEEGAVTLGGQPWHGTFSNDGGNFYVGNFTLNNFSVINTANFTAQTFGLGDGSDGLSQPHGIAISPENQRVFISNRNSGGQYQPAYNFGDNSNIGTVVVINTQDNSIEKVLEIENFGSGMRLWVD